MCHVGNLARPRPGPLQLAHMSWQEAYRTLADYLIENTVLASTGALLDWDEQTYMPPQGADGRSRQISLLSRMTHERFISRQVGDALGELAAAPLDEDAAANVREWQRLYHRAVRVPASLVQEMARTSVLSRQAWGQARAESSFAPFKPFLSRVIDLRRQYAACVLNHQPTSSDELYDALLDDYEPYATTAEIRDIFHQLRPRLVSLVAAVQASPRKAPADILHRCYPVQAQKEFSERTARLIGFDFQAGRLDATVHPFCTGITPGDTRITTRFDEYDFSNCFFSVIHETGHALYDQGLPRDRWGTPLGEAVSLGVHESQSRLWENLVARSEPFWQFLYPQAQAAFPAALAAVPLHDFLFAINEVSPSLIRTEADEVTYNLHIILRFEIEQLLLSGQLPVDDLPTHWNRLMQELLNIQVPDDRHGCLQDVHWSQGAFGYFPTYTLGNLNAAALFDAAGKALGDLPAQLATGESAPLLNWLRTHIHQHGKRYPARQLVQNATGSPLSIQPLVRHLETKVARYYRATDA